MGSYYFYEPEHSHARYIGEDLAKKEAEIMSMWYPWHRWFAWHPVPLIDGGWAWLRVVERRHRYWVYDTDTEYRRSYA